MALSTNPTRIIAPLLPSTDTNSARPIDSAAIRNLTEEFRPAVQKLLAFSGEPETTSPNIALSPSAVIHRLRPPVKAHGGKYYLARRIVPILLGVREKISEYLEPCAFGASVFLAMPRVQREILGDINPDVAALWSVLSDERSAADLVRHLSGVSYTRSEFEEAKRDAGEITQLGRAARFLIRCRFSRGGLGTSFAWSERTRGGRPGDENAWETFRQQELPRIIARARGVEVTNDSCWWTVWQSREKIHRLIYADPPYMPQTRSARTAYGPNEMTLHHHFWLVAALRAHSGPAAISGYRCDEYDRWLKDWRRFDFDMPNNAGQTKRKQRRTESLWTNW
ncbi:MAG: DNA adenine methylase [Planctomycetes bacterium]|nr:DNA adenine methylase [Planctomycetota bacterium]